MVQRVVQETEKLDVYVDNAGRIAMGALVDQTADEVVADSMTNVVGFQIILGEAVKTMRETGGGRVVSLLSIAADGVPHQSRYAGAKAYKFGVLRSAAIESLLSRDGITYSAVAPGLSPTAMTEVVEERARPGLLKMIGQERELTPAEVSDYIIFAASSHLPEDLNGQVIPVFKPMELQIAA